MVHGVKLFATRHGHRQLHGCLFVRANDEFHEGNRFRGKFREKSKDGRSTRNNIFHPFLINVAFERKKLRKIRA